MARKPRIEYPGAFYHVMCRGNNGEHILHNDEDKKFYLYLIQKYKERYCFRIFAYCIMDNHVHMLIQTGDVPLSKIMQAYNKVSPKDTIQNTAGLVMFSNRGIKQY